MFGRYLAVCTRGIPSVDKVPSTIGDHGWLLDLQYLRLLAEVADRSSLVCESPVHSVLVHPSKTRFAKQAP